MNHIFISHSHEDSDFAEVCQARLKQAAFTGWRDVGIRGGSDWRREIDQAIKEAIAVIVVMTPEAKASEYVTYEWAVAWGAGVKVIPILLKETQLHPRLESLQYLNFTSRTARPWDDLIIVLRETESSRPEEPIPPRPELVIFEDDKQRMAHRRMIEALRDEKWLWRSIERLAIIAGVPQPEALEILAQDPNVSLGRGKSGRKIAKLAVR